MPLGHSFLPPAIQLGSGARFYLTGRPTGPSALVEDSSPVGAAIGTELGDEYQPSLPPSSGHVWSQGKAYCGGLALLPGLALFCGLPLDL